MLSRDLCNRTTKLGDRTVMTCSTSYLKWKKFGVGAHTAITALLAWKIMLKILFGLTLKRKVEILVIQKVWNPFLKRASVEDAVGNAS